MVLDSVVITLYEGGDISLKASVASSRCGGLVVTMLLALLYRRSSASSPGFCPIPTKQLWIASLSRRAGKTCTLNLGVARGILEAFFMCPDRVGSGRNGASDVALSPRLQLLNSTALATLSCHFERNCLQGDPLKCLFRGRSCLQRARRNSHHCPIFPEGRSCTGSSTRTATRWATPRPCAAPNKSSARALREWCGCLSSGFRRVFVCLVCRVDVHIHHMTWYALLPLSPDNGGGCPLGTRQSLQKASCALLVSVYLGCLFVGFAAVRAWLHVRIDKFVHVLLYARISTCTFELLIECAGVTTTDACMVPLVGRG